MEAFSFAILRLVPDSGKRNGDAPTGISAPLPSLQTLARILGHRSVRRLRGANETILIRAFGRWESGGGGVTLTIILTAPTRSVPATARDSPSERRNVSSCSSRCVSTERW